MGFYCQERMGTRSSVKEDKLVIIKHATKKVISETIKNIEERFDDMLSHPVIKSVSVMNPQNWPDGEALHDYGDIEIETIYTAFGKLLQNRILI